LALAQVDSTVGDLPGNAETVRDWSRRAAEAGAHLVAFPEMMLTGYPVEDLVFRESFVAASRDALHVLARDLAEEGLGGRTGVPATRSPCCPLAGSSPPTSSTTCPTTASSTRTATSSPVTRCG